MLNLKISDKSVEHIINKVMNRKLKDSKTLSNRYQPQPEQDSRIINCSLQDENLELKRQFKKLEGMLKGKMKIREKLNSTQGEIEELREKLRSVLNASQVLQQSLFKIRNRGSKLTINRSYQQRECCCSKRRKSQKQANITKKVQKSPFNIEPEVSPQRQQEGEIFEYMTMGKKPKPMQITKQSQTQWNYLGAEQLRVQSKKEHIEKLKNIIESQNKMIHQYEQQLLTNAKVGKIAKASQLKLGSVVKTCASYGSIVRASKIKLNK